MRKLNELVLETVIDSIEVNVAEIKVNVNALLNTIDALSNDMEHFFKKKQLADVMEILGIDKERKDSVSLVSALQSFLKSESTYLQGLRHISEDILANEELIKKLYYVILMTQNKLEA